MIEITSEYLREQGLSETFPTRFWSKVNKIGPIPTHRPELGNCWIWTASRHDYGYGQISSLGHGRVIKSHVASWLIHNGPIAKGQCVCHKCDNPPCVNPDHLFLDTRAGNLKDMRDKGRAATGERHGQSKLSVCHVIRIRELCDCGTMTKVSIANLFGVSDGLVQLIHKRKIWRHV